MEADNKVPIGEMGGRRKSFLEKLGLVEPISESDSQDVSSEIKISDVPQSPASINSLFQDDTPAENIETSATSVYHAEPAPAMFAETEEVNGIKTTEDMSETETPEAAESPDDIDEPVPFTKNTYFDESAESVYPAAFIQPEPVFMPSFSQAPDAFLAGDSDSRPAAASQKNIQMLTVPEIYALFNLTPMTERETVYLIENLLQALPANLPLEIKKDSLQKLLRASSFDSDRLAADGQERIKTLEHYLENFMQDLEDVIAYNEAQVAELKEKIRRHTEMIAEKSRMIAEQKSLVRFESHRISALLDSLEKGN